MLDNLIAYPQLNFNKKIRGTKKALWKELYAKIFAKESRKVDAVSGATEDE